MSGQDIDTKVIESFVTVLADAAQAMNAAANAVMAAEQRQRRHDRKVGIRQAAAGGLLAIIALYAAFVGTVTLVHQTRNHELLTETRSIAKAIERQQSPATQLSNAQLLLFIVDEVECRTRRATSGLPDVPQGHFCLTNLPSYFQRLPKG